MKRFSKKLAAIILVAVMAVSLFPASVFAEPELVDKAVQEVVETAAEEIAADEETTAEEVIADETEAAAETEEAVAEEAAEAEIAEETAEEVTEEIAPVAEAAPIEEVASAEEAAPEAVAQPAETDGKSTTKGAITAQPQDAIVAPFGKATFSVGTEGTVKKYQWQYSSNGRLWINMSSFAYGKSEISITGSNAWLTSNNGFQYRCVVTFKDGSKITSDAATLYVASAQEFKDDKVTADAPAGTFPDGTTMAVTDVDAAEHIDAINTVLGDVAVENVTAVDISFSHEGAEIEPANGNKVTVTLKADVIKEGVQIVHIDDEGNTTLIDEEDIVSVKDGEIVFASDAFSVYAIIGEVVIENEADSFEFETDDYKITVSYTKEAKIPVGTELVVSQIEYDSDEYWNYWNKSLDKLNENAVKAEESEDEIGTYRGIADAAFFDISLMYKGKEFEPEVPLQVEIALKQGGLPLFDGQTVEVIHFGEAKANNADGTELIEDVQFSKAGPLSEGMPEGVAVDSVIYDQTGFSVSAVITTDEYINFETAEYVPELGNLNQLADRMLLAAPMLRASGDPTINAGKTVTDTDGDGIYELALSVNATSQQSSETKPQKSNIVMVIDVSGSMGNEQSWIYYDTYTYNASTYNEYRYYTSSSSTNTRLYYGQFRTGGYNSQVRTGWYSGGNTYNGNVYNATAYSGTVYAYETRLHATQRAACAVVDALLAKNVNDDNITDMFEITVVKFANLTASGNNNGTEMVIRDSTNGTAIKNAINGLTSGGGTNWEAALNLAKTEADYYKNTDTSQMHDPEEITSVIFLTDGFPTYYVNNNGNQGGGGGEGNDNVSTSYTEARPSARTIVSNGYTLYNIFAFGSDTTTHGNNTTGSHTGFEFLRGLTNYAYGSGNTNNFNETDVTRQHAFNAKSTDDLIKAFETIIDHITNNVGYAGVNLTDGVSLGATSTSVAVNGTAKAESMRYTVKDASGKIAYTVKFNSSGAATFTIYNADGTTSTLTDSTPETVTTTIGETTITSQVYEVVVGSGDDAKHYKMSPATINANNGMVQWDLAGLGILESGYTYTVAFDVWPNQLAYDIAADLNNGIYANVDAALDAYGVTDATERQHIKDAIVKNADGSYSLYTNYEQSIEYYPATSETDDEGNVTWTYGDKQEQEIPHPDPVPLKGSLLPMAKVWESDLALSELNELLWKNGIVDGESLKYQITLHLWKADTREELEAMAGAPISSTNQPYITVVLGWDDEIEKYVFEKDAAVAPGTMVNLEEAAELGFDITDTSKIKVFTNDEGTELEYYMIEEGHYYLVTEEGSDLHFELESPLYHPMIVDGTLYNVYFGSGQTVEQMDPMAAVTATNYLKGGLNIRKAVSSTQIPDTFKKIEVPTYEDGKVVVDEETGEPVMREVDDVVYTPVPDCEDEFAYKITIWREDDDGAIQPVYTYDDQFNDDFSAISGSIGYREFGVDENGEFVTLGRNVIVFEDTENAAEKIAANKRGDNDPVYATLTNDNKTQIILRMPANGEIRLVNLPGGTKYTVEEVVDADGPYTFAATKSEIKYDDDNVEYIAVGTNNGVSGKIKGNTANVETFYNWAANFYVYHSASNKMEKISFADERVSGTYDAEKGEYIYTFNIAEETGRDSKDSPVTGVANKDDKGNVLSYYFTGGYLYGGYYSAYGGAAMTDAQITEKAESGNAEYKDGWAADATGAKPYDGKSLYVSGTTRFWVKGKAITSAKGNAMNPEVGSVYYLKEVPSIYLQTNARWVYDLANNNEIINIYMLTCIDDTYYKQTGFTADAVDSKASISSKFVYQFRGSDTPETPVTPADLIGQRGYLGVVDISAKISAIESATSDAGISVNPYWNTLDDLRVISLGYSFYNTDGSGTLTSDNIGYTENTAD